MVPTQTILFQLVNFVDKDDHEHNNVQSMRALSALYFATAFIKVTHGFISEESKKL